ncbi:MAG TPA: AlpA family phage regulatory protein [Rhodanobacteraceae bacterium]|nr:AlpA family phage regulatory protein [Rhodanobacteraceae bacterium]
MTDPVHLSRAEMAQPERLLPMRAVRDQVALHPATVYAMVKDGTFPKPVKLGRRSLWIESEVQAWIAERIKESREAA